MKQVTRGTTIRSEIAEGRQGRTYIEILRLGSFVCEINIESDSYRFQCHALGKVWSEQDRRWNVVATIPYSLMATPEGLYVRGLVSASDFKADRDSLVTRLIEVLGDPAPTRSGTRRSQKDQ